MKDKGIGSRLQSWGYGLVSRYLIGRLDGTTRMSKAEFYLDSLKNLADKGDDKCLMAYALEMMNDKKPWFDPAEGMLALSVCAQHGSSAAQYYYGNYIFNGKGVDAPDERLGRYWIEQAAAQGFADAIKWVNSSR